MQDNKSQCQLAWASASAACKSADCDSLLYWQNQINMAFACTAKDTGPPGGKGAGVGAGAGGVSPSQSANMMKCQAVGSGIETGMGMGIMARRHSAPRRLR